MDKCPICLKSDVVKKITRIDMSKGIYFISCEVCGDFKISEIASEDIDSLNTPRFIISSIIRNHTEFGEDILITTTSLKDLIDSVSLPSEDPFERIDLLLKYIYRKTDQPSKSVYFKSNRYYPILYLKTSEDFLWHIKKARELNLIEPDPETGQGYQLSLDGWRRIFELKKTEKNSCQAFVAMWQQF